MASSIIPTSNLIYRVISSNGAGQLLAAASFFKIPPTNNNYYLVSIVDSLGNRGLYTVQFQSGGSWVISYIMQQGFTALAINTQGTITPSGGTGPYHMQFIFLTSFS